jgi:hypothetical protein
VIVKKAAPFFASPAEARAKGFEIVTLSPASTLGTKRVTASDAATNAAVKKLSHRVISCLVSNPLTDVDMKEVTSGEIGWRSGTKPRERREGQTLRYRFHAHLRGQY